MTGPTTAAVELQKYVQRVEYPCVKADLLAEAVHAGAPPDLLHRIHALPATTFTGPEYVSAHIARLDGGGRRRAEGRQLWDDSAPEA